MPQPLDLLLRFAAFTGLRAGETHALRRKHVDLARGVVIVAEAVSEVHGALVYGTPKTHQTRVVGLPGCPLRHVGRGGHTRCPRHDP